MVAIVVPYRDRKAHIASFLLHMHKFLQDQHREYCITFAEQNDEGQFNRGKLMNAGFEYVMQQHTFWKKLEKTPDCFIFHDIDLLPESHKLLYGCYGYRANHLCDKFNSYDYKMQDIAGNTVSSGGIITVSTWQYLKVNGHPNRYWGWGFEDHEGSLRFRSYNASNDLHIPDDRRKTRDFMNEYIEGTTEDHGDIGMVRNEDYGYYTQMKHSKGFTHGFQNKQFWRKQYFKKHGFTYSGANWIAMDGLNTLFYKIVKIEEFIGYTSVSFET